MKIIHLINSLDIGGAEKTLVRLVNKSKHSHAIITILNSHKLKSLVNKELPIISILPFRFKKLYQISEFVKYFEPDLFQGWMYHGDFFATLFGIFFKKKIYWNIRHGKMSLKYSSKKTILLRSFLSLLSYFFPKKIISCSFCGVSVHKNIGYSNHKFKVIHNGIDFKKANISLSQDISTRRSLNICSIGRNSPQKNRTYFVSILQELSNFLKINSLIIGRDVTKSNELKKYTLLPNINLNLKESKNSTASFFINCLN